MNDLSHLCGASMATPAQMIGPCLLRADHDGPVHQGPDEIRWSGSALASTDSLAAAIARVRELHEEIDCECTKCVNRRENEWGCPDTICKECSDGNGASGAAVWPCATIAALDQPAAEMAEVDGVCTYQSPGGYVVADGGGWVPGEYPTREAAIRAAWNMRDHGTVEDKPGEPPCPTT